MGFFKRMGMVDTTMGFVCSPLINPPMCGFFTDKNHKIRFFSSTSCWIPSPELSVCHAKLKGKRHAKSARYDRNSQSGFERLKRQACNGWRDCTEYAPDARTLPVNTDAACDGGVI